MIVKMRAGPGGLIVGDSDIDRFHNSTMCALDDELGSEMSAYENGGRVFSTKLIRKRKMTPPSRKKLLPPSPPVITPMQIAAIEDQVRQYFTEGSDDRLHLNKAGLNKYHVAPRVEPPTTIQRAFCTCSPPSQVRRFPNCGKGNWQGQPQFQPTTTRRPIHGWRGNQC